MSSLIAFDERLDPNVGTGEEPCSGGRGLETGTVIGDCYRILGLLGKGAMGAVYLAHDDRLDRRVAVKCIHPHLLTEGFRERFELEARAMARVSHPNVVQVHAYGEHDAAPYFVMEYVGGPTLEQWMSTNRAPRNVDLALRILDDLCRGVAAIHAASTVHRDIKPSNILLDNKLRVRVADLGVAVVHLQERAAIQGIVGTPAYMAPEIAFSTDVDPEPRSRADVYSVACVAYEIFTGRPPFDGAGNIGLHLQHATTAVARPSSVRSDLPRGLDEPVLRALAKNPQERTPTVEAFRCDLLAACRRERDPLRILVAEDDDDFRSALKLFLELNFPQAEIECVQDGQQALDAVDRSVPSIAIADLRMPALGGIELTARLRARASSASMPIIILTASGGPEEWRRLAALGADRFLLKPVVLEDLAVLVRRVLAERSGSAPPRVVA